MMELLREKDAKRLVERDCFELQGRKFFVKPFLQGKKRKQFKEQVRQRRAFIHNVSPHLDTEDIRQIFGCVAEIEDAFLINKNLGPTKTRNNPNKLQYGYVMFKNLQDALKWKQIGKLTMRGITIFISAYRDHKTKGQTFQVPKSQKEKSDRKKDTKNKKIRAKQSHTVQHRSGASEEQPSLKAIRLRRQPYRTSQNISSYNSFQNGSRQLDVNWRQNSFPIRKSSEHFCRSDQGKFCAKCCSSKIEENHFTRNLRFRKSIIRE
jgi:Ni/Co efflux regulator RcnB